VASLPVDILQADHEFAAALRQEATQSRPSVIEVMTDEWQSPVPDV
jgi:hypothetical protein